jgi:soluble lytic murein transglycosylase-like protein
VRWTGLVLVVLLAVRGTDAQAENAHQLLILSLRWAAYYAEMYHVPVELVGAIIEQESGWNPDAVSNKGAAGLMQLMPATARRFGVRNRFQIEENIRGGVAYLALLNDQFHGDLRLVTAAYYVGESTIQLRGQEYSSRDVYGYVCRVAQRYQARRRASMNLRDEVRDANP